MKKSATLPWRKNADKRAEERKKTNAQDFTHPFGAETGNISYK